MDASDIIRELGGGAMAVMIVGQSAAIVMLWLRITALQDRLFDAQATASKELREIQAASNAALSANTAALSAMSVAMQSQGRAG